MGKYTCRLCDSDVALLRDWKVKNISDDIYYYLAKQVRNYCVMKVDHILLIILKRIFYVN